MAYKAHATAIPTHEELVECLAVGLKSLPVEVTLATTEVAIEELAQAIIDHLHDAGYAIKRKV